MSYSPPGSLSDPAGSNPLVDAALWLQGTVLGTVATTIAVIAVASIGFLMLSGRIDWRRGATTVLGCFIVFGAGSIAAGIRSAGGALDGPVEQPVATVYAPPYVSPLLPKSAPSSPSSSYDPYAGASVPVR